MNKLKLGKKKILGFVTAGAIVVTMAGSYATWDTLTNTATSAALTIDKPIELTVGNLTYTASPREWDTTPVYTSDDVTFTANNVPDGVDAKVAVTAGVYDSETNGNDLTGKFTVKINDTEITESNKTVETEIGKEVAAADKKAVYKVSITPNEANKNELGGTQVYVRLTGTLSEKK